MNSKKNALSLAGEKGDRGHGTGKEDSSEISLLRQLYGSELPDPAIEESKDSPKDRETSNGSL